MATCVQCGRPLSRYSPGPECGACAWSARAQIAGPPPLDESFWEETRVREAARSRDLQTLLRAYLQVSGLTQETLALLIGTEQGTVSKIIRGQRKRFTVDDLEAVRDGLHIPGHLLGLAPGPHEPQRQAHHQPTAADAQPDGEESDDALTGSLIHASSSTRSGDEDVERRQLLQLAALGLSAGTLHASGEPVRQLLASLTDGESRDLEDWHLSLSDHLHALRTRPAGQARDGLLVDLAAISRQLRSAQPAAAIELHRIAAGLAMLCANVTTRLGDHSSAIRWWRTARASADASTDLDLRLMVRAEEAGCGLYGQRDPKTIVLLLERAERIAARAGTTHSFWLADFAGTRAKAMALIGNHTEARHALDTFVAAAADGRRASGGLLPDLFKEDQIHFAQSWVYAQAGEETRADQARSNVLSLTGDYQYTANVRLHEALCTVVNGGITTGARRACEILDALAPAEHTQMINETARGVLNAIPAENRREPAVRDLQALTATTIH